MLSHPVLVLVLKAAEMLFTRNISGRIRSCRIVDYLGERERERDGEVKEKLD